MMDRMNKKERTAYKMEVAIWEITAAGCDVHYQNTGKILFMFNDSEIEYFPLKEWASGKTIRNCRGLKNLIKQLS